MTLAIGHNESIFLNIVRTLSAWAVLVGHYLSFASGGTSFLGDTLPIQTLGVVVFFLLSGYLISATASRRVVEHPEYNFQHFLIDRFTRIYVTLIPCLLIIAALDLINYSLPGYGHRDAFNAETFIGNLLMLQDHPVLVALDRFQPDLATITSFGSGRPLWTLAVEWWLYMAYGWIALKLARTRQLTTTDKALTGLLLLAPTLYLIGDRRAVATLCWLAGCLMAGVRTNSLPTLTRSRATILLLASLALFQLRLRELTDFYDFHAAFFLGIAFWLSLRLVGTMRPLVVPKPAKQAIGIMAGSSYALYVLHYSIADFAMARFDQLNAMGWIICALISGAVAIAVYSLFDAHYRAVADLLKRRLYRKLGQICS